MPSWLKVQQSKAVFLITLYDSIIDMKHFLNVSITPQPCHSHFCCWLLPIWPKLDFWAENGAYGMCRLGWWYKGAKQIELMASDILFGGIIEQSCLFPDLI